MKVIELLACQLDREAKPHEIQATQHTFSEAMEFWNLCLEARRLLIDENISKEEKICSISQQMKSGVGELK